MGATVSSRKSWMPINMSSSSHCSVLLLCYQYTEKHFSIHSYSAPHTQLKCFFHDFSLQFSDFMHQFDWPSCVYCTTGNGEKKHFCPNFFPVDRLYKRYSKHHDLQMSSSPFDSIKLNKSSVFFSFWHLATSSTYLGPISAPFLKVSSGASTDFFFPKHRGLAQKKWIWLVFD